MNHQPLTDTDYTRMHETLSRFRSERAMNLEALGGFFAALICCPDMVNPSEYLPEIWGARGQDSPAFNTVQECQAFVRLMTRYWGVLACTLDSGKTYLPLVLEDENGNIHGNDWAAGFLRGMSLRRNIWNRMLNDEVAAEVLAPIFILAYEHGPVPDLWPAREPIDDAQRAQLLASAAAGVIWAHGYFGPHHRQGTQLGCRDVCPGGVGPQCKQCFAGVVMH